MSAKTWAASPGALTAARTAAWAVALAAASIAHATAHAATLQFSGYTWEVRQGGGGPGPNHWDARNVWVDANGALHLLVTQRDGVWTAAEVTMTQRLGFGTYQWQIEGRPDQMDRNLVLGLFNYPTSDVGPDGTNEIDIEFARWGNDAWPNGNWTIYPAELGTQPLSTSFEIALDNLSTHRFTWSASRVRYATLNGLRDIGDNTGLLKRKTFAPGNRQRIPQQALPVHMNLWLYQGRAPSNGQPVEVVIRSFRFVPG
jgi:hypothetical protein